MTQEEFEIVSDDICANSTCKNCLLNEICKTVQVGDDDAWRKLYPYFIKNIPIRENVRKWMVTHGYTTSH